MLYILTFLLMAQPQGLLNISMTSDGRQVNLYLPLSLVKYTDTFIESEMEIGKMLEEVELGIGDTLMNIDTEEERIVMAVVAQEGVLEQGETVQKKFFVEIVDKENGNISIKLPLWAFGVLSKFGGNMIYDMDVVFFEELVSAVRALGGGRLKFLEAKDEESSIKIYIE